MSGGRTVEMKKPLDPLTTSPLVSKIERLKTLAEGKLSGSLYHLSHGQREPDSL
jgi:hypothetical protein